MKTIKIDLYSFKELSKEAKAKVISKLSDINVDHKWYDFTYEDAENIGLKIEESDWEYATAKGEFTMSAPEVAEKIKEGHGKKCETYKIASAFLNSIEGEKDDDKLTELEDLFLRVLLKEYGKMLREEWLYLQSEKAIIETIESNEYTFEADGKMRNA